MNLKASHLLPIAGGILVGAAIGFAISFILKKGTFATFERVVDLHSLCAVAGGMLGIVVAILALMRIESGDVESGMPHNFNSINGMGSALIGKWEKREDGSYLTTEWLTMLWIPVFPVCTYRVIQMAEPNLIYLKRYMVLEKRPVRLMDLGAGLIRSAAMLGVVAFCAWYLS